ncbi:MAG TPA: IPT/TIG domain-containing protein, partial [Myxococcota bacterium]|nr:IPT/TIG domain-containing protein [Myxococcota bacterium]
MGLRNTLFRLVPAAVLMAVGLVSCAGDDGWPDSGPDSTPGFDVPGEFVSDLDQPDLIDSDQFPAELPGQDGSVPDSDAPDSGPTYPLAVDSMAPRQGDPATSTMVTLTGSGFSAVVDVWFGQARSPSVFAISDGILNCVAPPARSGSVQVIVEDSLGR